MAPAHHDGTVHRSSPRAAPLESGTLSAPSNTFRHPSGNYFTRKGDELTVRSPAPLDLEPYCADGVVTRRLSKAATCGAFVAEPER